MGKQNRFAVEWERRERKKEEIGEEGEFEPSDWDKDTADLPFRCDSLVGDRGLRGVVFRAYFGHFHLRDPWLASASNRSCYPPVVFLFAQVRAIRGQKWPPTPPLLPANAFRHDGPTIVPRLERHRGAADLYFSPGIYAPARGMWSPVATQGCRISCVDIAKPDTSTAQFRSDGRGPTAKIADAEEQIQTASCVVNVRFVLSGTPLGCGGCLLDQLCLC
eukprot:904561-Amorphochlora_amoeboformis.AAC.1